MYIGKAYSENQSEKETRKEEANGLDLILSFGGSFDINQ